MVIAMHISELYISSFKGIQSKTLSLTPGINVIRGGKCSGKTSIVDSLLFIQRYSLTPTRSLEYLLNIWFGVSVAHGRSRSFEIMVHTRGSGESENGYYGLKADTGHNIIEEFYVVGDTSLIVRQDALEITSTYLFNRELAEREGIREDVWDRIRKRRLKISGLPWKTVASMVSSEVIHYGFDVAYKKVPQAVSALLVERMVDLSGEEKQLVKNRLVQILRYAFKVVRFFRRSVIVKNIDYKNAVGPSKIRGLTIDPHFSNLPWIIYRLYESRRVGDLLSCLESIGLNDTLHGVEKTIDQRYYLVVVSGRREVMRDGISTSFVKATAICTALHYADDLVVFDDFDEYLDDDLVHSLLKIMGGSGKQVLLTTRRKLIVGGVNRINIIDLHK